MNKHEQSANRVSWNDEYSLRTRAVLRRPPVDFFSVEEGLAALADMDSNSRSLPPLGSMQIPTKPMVPLPPVTPPDFGLQSLYPADTTLSPSGRPLVVNPDTDHLFSEQSYDTSQAFPADGDSQNYYDTMDAETSAKMEARRAVCMTVLDD